MPYEYGHVQTSDGFLYEYRSIADRCTITRHGLSGHSLIKLQQIIPDADSRPRRRSTIMMPGAASWYN
eukprot:scaffold57738_cov40-Prasinocladus_malaysianus.AAC.2